MQRFKRILSGILLLSLFLTVSAYGTPADIKDTRYAEAIETLLALDIMKGYPDGEFKPDENVNRAEFAALITRILGYRDIAESDKKGTVFADIDSEHWVAGNINISVDLGIIKGVGDGLFQPDAPILYEQAIKMLVCALGYEYYAEQKGGYPVGYLAVAVEKKITSGVDQKVGTAVTRGAVAQLIYNSLDVDIVEQISYGEVGKYSITKGETLLTKKLNIHKRSGVVMAVGDTSLVGSSTLNEDEIEIDRVIYKISEINSIDCLGHWVTFYVNEDRGINEYESILYLRPEENKNKIVSVDAKNIDERTNKQIFIYWNDKENDKSSEEVRLSDVCDMIYNGKAFPGFTDEDLKPESGMVKLLDNNGDGIYDVVFVISYEILVVDSVSLSSYKIYNKYNPGRVIELDPNDKNLTFSITKNDRPAQLKDIVEWNVIAVAESKGPHKKKNIDIIARATKVQGIVEEISDDRVTINGKEYKIAKSYQKAVLQNNDKAVKITAGSNGAFYLDIDENIAAVDTSSLQQNNYAFLIDAAMTQGVRKRIEFKLFSSTGEIVTLAGADKIELDGVKNLNSEDVYNSLCNSENVIESQLIKYEINDANEIKLIDTVNYNEGLEDKESLRLSIPKTRLIYKAGPKNFGGAFIITADTVIFSVPENIKNAEAYEILEPGHFYNDSYYEVEAYDASKTMQAKVMVYPSTGGATFSDEEPVALVDKVTKSISSRGEVVHKMNALQDGQSVELYAENDSILANIKQGDIVRYILNDRREIKLVEVLYNSNNAPEVYNANVTSYNAKFRTQMAEVTYKENNVLLISYGHVIDPSEGIRTNQETINVGSASVYLYDRAKQKVSLASVQDIESWETAKEDASKVFIAYRFAGVRAVIIIKW